MTQPAGRRCGFRTAIAEPLGQAEKAAPGAADLNGRLTVGLGAWSFLFRNGQRNELIGSRLFFNGAFIMEYVNKPFWRMMPPAIGDHWIDSTLAAAAIASEPVAGGMLGREGLWLCIEPQRERQLWAVKRMSADEATNTLFTQAFLLDARTGVIVFDTIEIRRRGKLIDTRKNLRVSPPSP